jgi:hypothetical protein
VGAFPYIAKNRDIGGNVSQKRNPDFGERSENRG